MNKLILIFLLFVVLSAKAQPDYQATLQEVTDKGFYIVHLPLAVRGHANADLSDLRIINQEGKQVPYLVRKDIQIYDKEEFIPYPVLSKNDRSHQSRYLIATQGDTISTLVLNIKNADVVKTANLKGSNDTVNWYSVKEHFILSGNFNSNGTSGLQTIEFPLSDYQYYLLTIDDSLSAPLNITDIGRTSFDYQVYHNMVTVPGELQSQYRGDTTWVTLNYGENYPVCGLRLYVSQPEFFRRNIQLSDTLGHRVRTVIHSEEPSSLFIPWNRTTSCLFLSIFNGDNPMLRVDSIQSYSDRLYLIAYFPEAGKYNLTYGDPHARQPDYDLAFFENKIPSTLPQLEVTSPQKLQQADDNTSENPFMLFLRKYGLWILISAVSLQILYFVRKMIKE